MTGRLGPILLALGILCATCAWAQNDTGAPDTNVPTQPGPKPAFTYPDAAPSLDFLNGAVENSSITLGLGTGFSYTSNTYGTISGSQNRWLFNVTPSIKIQQFLPKLAWHVSYSGGYQTYTQPSHVSSGNYNLFSQNAGAGFLWQLAKRWQLMADDTFIYSANPFDSFYAIPGTPTINNPNPTTFYPLTKYTTNNGVMTLTDQLTKVDTLAFSGTANLRRTSNYNLVTSVPFYNLISYGGRAAYSHDFSARLNLGASYDYNSLDFGRGQERSGIQTIQITGSYKLRPNVTISGWIGPEYTSTKTETFLNLFFCGQIVCHTSLWSTSLGANFSWQGLRNSVRAGYSRQASDGGGYLGTSLVNSVHGDYRRSLTPKMDASVGMLYFHDVSTLLSSRTFQTVSFNATLTYRVSKSLTANGNYAYFHQTHSNAFIIGPGNYNTNLVGASINYTWEHPLGR